MQIWDTLIVGAGPAGCAAAFDLAQAGRSVLLLDRATFPRPKACAAGLTVKTLRALRYSVAPVTHRTIYTIRLEGPGAAPATVTTRDPICVTAVREEFDLFCLGQTLAAGARLQQIGPVTSLTQTETGVTITTATATFHGRYLLGADGANSQIRKLLQQSRPPSNGYYPERSAAEPQDLRLDPAQAPEPAWLTRGFALETHLPLPTNAPIPDLLFDFNIPAGYAWIFPKRDHLNVGLGFFSTTHAPTARRALTHYIAQSPTLAYLTTTVRHSELELAEAEASPRFAPAQLRANPESSTPTRPPTPLKVTGQYLAFGFPRYTPADRVLLAGDAAGTLDPLTAEGIYPAITSGQAAAQAIHQSLTTGQPAAPLYLALTEDLRAQLTFSARAARRFYADPSLGLRALHLPLMRKAIVRTYALGLARPALLSRIATYALKLRPTA